MNELEDFIEAAEETMINVVGLARRKDGPQEDAQIAMFVTDDELMAGQVLFATGSVSNDREFLAISVRAFDEGQAVEPEVMILNGEILVTLKNT